MRAIHKTKISDFYQVDPIPKASFIQVNKLLRTGKLFRYIGNKPADSETSLLEKEIAKYLGVKYALALNSCSSAIFLSLMCCGIKPGDKVLIPAFTFTAVPSTVIHAGGIPILVGCNERYCIDINDLQKKISSETKILVLSHMRGNTSDLDSISWICKKNNIILIEDAAHSLGALWNGKPVGTYGKAGCYSFQSYKIINAGEGGLLITNDEEFIVKAIYLSGTYDKLYEQHFVQSKFFKKYHNVLPCFSMRMNNVSAAIIRPQIKEVEKKVAIYNKNYKYLAKALSVSKFINIPKMDPRERPAHDSIQFNIKGFSLKIAEKFMTIVRKKGVSLYVFGVDKDNVRVFWNWKYLRRIPELRKTREILQFTCDVRLPYFFKNAHLNYIAKVILRTLKDLTD